MDYDSFMNKIFISSICESVTVGGNQSFPSSGRAARATLPSTISLSLNALLMHLFRLLVLAMIPQHKSQVVHACQSMELQQTRFSQFHFLSLAALTR